MSSNHLILYRPLLLLASIFSSIRVFSNESVLHIRWPKYWSFSFIISPSNEYSGLISFRMDWLDLHAVQGLYSNTKLLLVAQSCPALWDPMDCSMSGFPVFHHLPELAQTHVHPVGDAIRPSHPLSSPSLPASILPSIRVFSNESALPIRWPQYWSFSFSIKSLQLIFRVDFL